MNPKSDRLFRTASCLVLLALAGRGELAGRQRSFGPLASEEGAPLQRLSYTPVTEGAELLERGSLAVDLWVGLSNVFEQDSSATHVLFIDMERLVTATTLRFGVGEGVEVAARLTLETTGGGVLDSFVNGYHELLGLGQANRDRFPLDRYSQRLTDGRTTYLDVGPRTLGLEDVRLSTKWRAAHGDGGKDLVSLRAEARIPAQSNRAGARRADLSLAALGRLGAGAWTLHGMLGAATARSSPELEPVLRRGSAFLALAAERALGRSVGALVQYQVTTPLLEGFHHRELDWPAGNLVVGVAGGLGDAWRWDVSFQEDLPPDTPAVDFTFGVRLSRIWR